MKILNRILLLLLPLSLNAGTYYVATNGDNDNPGTIGEPWLTWAKAFSTAVAGDTVYFRGGVYYTVGDQWGERNFNSGTAENWICFFNYPNETPILDCGNKSVSVPPSVNRGIHIQDASYIHIKGLHIRNVYQVYNDVECTGFMTTRLNVGKFENMVVHHVAGIGYQFNCFDDTIAVINCDAYNLNDSLRTNPTPPGSPGQNGVAFQPNNLVSQCDEDVKNSKIYYHGCRAWNFADNGMAGGLSYGFMHWDSCWNFSGGLLTGDGCWKYLSQYVNDSLLHLDYARRITYCISACDGSYGFSTNNSGAIPNATQCYNNFAYHNGYRNKGLGHGWVIMNYTGNTPRDNEMYSNNIAYDNEIAPVWDFYGNVAYTHEYNSWDQDVTVTDADFISLDTLQLYGERQSDGSLPVITFGHLAETSDLIDAGVDVGLPYVGDAPDLGWVEYEQPGEAGLGTVINGTLTPSVYSATVGGDAIDDGGGTVSDKGICWSTSENPTTSNNHYSAGAGTGSFSTRIRQLTKNTTYHVRSYVTNEEGTAHSADATFTTFTQAACINNGKTIINNGQLILIK